MNIQVFESAGMGFVSFRPKMRRSLLPLDILDRGRPVWTDTSWPPSARSPPASFLQDCKIHKWRVQGKTNPQAQGEIFFQKQPTDGDREVGGRGPSSYIPPHARHKLNLSPCTGLSVLKLIYLCSYPAILPFLDSFLQSRPRNQVFLLQGNYLLFKNVFA